MEMAGDLTCQFRPPAPVPCQQSWEKCRYVMCLVVRVKVNESTQMHEHVLKLMCKVGKTSSSCVYVSKPC
jgi:hypothetical protein